MTAVLFNLVVLGINWGVASASSGGVHPPQKRVDSGTSHLCDVANQLICWSGCLASEQCGLNPAIGGGDTGVHQVHQDAAAEIGKRGPV